MKKQSNLIAQSTLEYVVVIMVAVAALLAMFSFLRRHVQGNWREAADSFGAGRQFDSQATRVIE